MASPARGVVSSGVSLPTPAQFERISKRVRGLLTEAEREYRWAYDLAYGAEGSSAPRVGSPRPFGEVDPTGAAATAEMPVRERAADLVTKLETMQRDLLTVINTLLPRPRAVERPDRFPRTITKDERLQLEEARARRLERGELG